MAGFNSFPLLGYQLLTLLPTVSKRYKLILSNSRKLSKKLANKMGPRKGNGEYARIITPPGKGSKKSRYSLILDESNNENIVFLDCTQTKESSLNFLILFLNSFFEKSTIAPLFDPKKASLVGCYLDTAFLTYNKKFGIEFHTVTEEFLNFTRFTYVKLRNNFLEYLVLRELSNDPKLKGQIADFVSGKIELVFDMVPAKRINLFLDTINLWGIQTDAFCMVAALAGRKSLCQLSRNKFLRENKQVAERIRRNPELVSALDNNLLNLESQVDFPDLDDYIIATGKALNKFIESLKPEYVLLDEQETLAKALMEYEVAIQSSPIALVYHPNFGGVDSFVDLLTKIFNKARRDNDIYPELAVTSGLMLVLFLNKLLEVERNRKYLENILTIGQEVSDFMVKSRNEIKQKDPESPFANYEQAGLALTGLIPVCLNNYESDLAMVINDKAQKLAEKYELTGILVQTHWTKFVFTQDYEDLLKVYKLYPKIVYPQIVEQDNSERSIDKMKALMAAGVFEERDKFAHYSEAITLSTGLPYSTKEVITSNDLFHERLTQYTIQIFFYVEKAYLENTWQSIKAQLEKSRIYARALESETSTQKALENVFAWKTLLLLSILEKDKEQTLLFCQKIENLPFKSTTNEMFLAKARNAFGCFSNKEFSDSLDIMDLPIEERDPWSRLLEKIFNLEFRTLLETRIKFFSRAILFVEGPTELKVFPIWASKLGYEFKEAGIGVIPLIGASKANFHLRFWGEIIESAKSFTKRSALPIFMIFDFSAKTFGDEAVNQGLVPQNNCFVLSSGDIEDYYPTDVLIQVLEEMTGKKPLATNLMGGRVKAIDHFLRKNGYLDEWKIQIGVRVAKLTAASQIPDEIKEIMEKIVKLS